MRKKNVYQKFNSRIIARLCDFFDFFGRRYPRHPHHTHEEGEIWICKQGQMSIRLRHKPISGSFYVEEPIVVPCAPPNNDDVDCYFTEEHGQHYLVIAWNVSSVRKVVWAAYYK